MRLFVCHNIFWVLPIFSLCFFGHSNSVIFEACNEDMDAGHSITENALYESPRHNLSNIGKSRPLSSSLYRETARKIRVDPEVIRMASRDYGKIIYEIPAGVLSPCTVSNIVNLIKISYDSIVPFNVAARGRGHSVRGQAMAKNGIVVDMPALNQINNNSCDHQVRSVNNINVSWSSDLGYYADVGGEQLWIDVLLKTLDQHGGLAPVSWTDYLHLTVGGTLSLAGISGQTFRHGPQINNVHEMDVVTGKGELITCSKHENSELFYGVLGGLGQFGIITRARIVLDKAPTRVKWLRMFYEDFSIFTRDQENLMKDGVDYLEGFVITENSEWGSSFCTSSELSRISSLLSERKILYCIEMVKYYDNQTAHTVDKGVDDLLQGLKYIPEFIFKKDESFLNFMNRVRTDELYLESKGLWHVPHPWLDLFIPKSDIMDFNAGVFVDILLKQAFPDATYIFFPMLKNKWDDQMSAVTPEEDIFFYAGILQSGRDDNWETLDDQNQQILNFCNKAGIKFKKYLPHHKTSEEWKKHFGPKWRNFAARKAAFDPKNILAPGHRIFN